MDPRHQRRVELLQDLFACTFTQHNLELCLSTREGTLADILKNIGELDLLIQQVAPERPLADINKVDLAILRLIVFESKHTKTPKKVLIDEGIELAKEFGSENSSRFVNGALAKLLLES
ncbi:MAG: transcription antitermination protein NusB [Patescibacteria group bacterium]|nr:transcription antitermination protein NusB [Patescibacteria group bacterium]